VLEIALMGWFQKWYDDPRYADVRYLSRQPAIGCFREQKGVTLECLYRLGHLIYRLEVRPCWGNTSSAAKWYLQNLPKVVPAPPPQLKPVFDTLTARLRAAIQAYDTETNTIWDASMFGAHVDYVYHDRPEMILHGPSLVSAVIGMGPPGETPAGRLCDIIRFHCWSSSL
jgi:hypothetical protein